MISLRPFAAILCLSLLPACVLRAADDDDNTIRRPSIGFRVSWYATRMFETGTVTYSTTKPVADYTITSNSSYARFFFSPTAEFRIKPKLSVSGEFRFHHASFIETSQMKSGVVDPNANADDRLNSTIKRSNKANYWEFPFLVRYYGIRKKGWWSPAYVGAGVEYQHIGRVRTGTDYTWADGVTDYNEIPTAPAHANQVGVIAAAGMRLVDYATHLKVNVEARYIRWQGRAFEAQSYRSTPNQVEVGIGFSY
jgi:hypothetical protein